MEQKYATRLLQAVLVGIAVVFTVISASPVSALDVPPLTGRIVDLAHVLPQSTLEALTARLTAHEGQSSNQVAVLTIPSLESESLEEFTHRVATTWKLGRKGTDNGVLLLVAIKERKVRIEVGYGLEGILTDVRSAQIIRNEIIPRFRAGDMSGGILEGTYAILKTIDGTYQATENAPLGKRGLLSSRLWWRSSPGCSSDSCSQMFIASSDLLPVQESQRSLRLGWGRHCLRVV